MNITSKKPELRYMGEKLEGFDAIVGRDDVIPRPLHVDLDKADNVALVVYDKNLPRHFSKGPPCARSRHITAWYYKWPQGVHRLGPRANAAIIAKPPWRVKRRVCRAVPSLSCAFSDCL